MKESLFILKITPPFNFSEDKNPFILVTYCGFLNILVKSIAP
nr:MAG TPA: hypothetical protein [Caudoviricetes sp.]